MGMDVYGKAPVDETGEYFRNNVWWWRPLWNYCNEVAPELVSKVENGHTNDGDGLNVGDAIKLGNTLLEELESGDCAKYAERYREHMDSLPLVLCDLCEGTGRRLEPPSRGAGDYPCNACGGNSFDDLAGTGKVKNWETWYPFSVENVQDFAAFLKKCGGFEIC